MASEISSISHLGVEVAPQTPMELAPANRELSISSALSIKCELGILCPTRLRLFLVAIQKLWMLWPKYMSL